MNLLPDADQAEIVAGCAAFLAREMPIARLRAGIARAQPTDDAVWRASAELGWFGLGLPEAAGGVGGTLADEALLFREIGRSLAPGPYIASVLGARVASCAGESALAAEVLAGRSRVALALTDASAALRTRRLRGALRVLDADGASHVLIASAEGAALVALCDLPALVPEKCIDDATTLASCAGADAPLAAIALAAQDTIHARGLVFSAAQLVGIAEACRDAAAEHAKTRIQFDRPIGVNQAIKHPCANAAIRAEAAWCQTAMAAVMHDEGLAGSRREALCARIVAAEAAEQNAATLVQVMGGMGFTFEHDAHLYVKRAQVLCRMLGDTRALLEELIAL